MTNMLEEFAAMANDGPADADLRRLAEKAAELAQIEQETKELEEKLKDLKTRRHEMRTRTIPDMMHEVGVDRIGVPGAGVDVALKDHCHASISKTWDAEKRFKAFEELRRAGGGDLIKTELVVAAGKGHDAAMEQLANRVQQMLAEYNINASVKMEPNVQWNSLTSFVKSIVKSGDPIDLEVVGATYETVAEIITKEK
jgi:hypothetical protein